MNMLWLRLSQRLKRLRIERKVQVMSREMLRSILDEMEEKREHEQVKTNSQEQYRSEWIRYVAEYRG